VAHDAQRSAAVAAVYQQTQCWLKAGVFEVIVRDLRKRMPQPRAAILDSRMLQSSPESSGRAGYDGHKRRRGSKVHLAGDALGQSLAVWVTPANEQDRAQVAALAEQIQEATGDSKSPSWIRATRATSLPLALRRTASAWKWSDCRWPSAALCCCPVAGSSNAVLPGWCASGDWLVTMNAWRRRWPGCTSSPSTLLAHRLITFMVQSA